MTVDTLNVNPIGEAVDLASIEDVYGFFRCVFRRGTALDSLEFSVGLGVSTNADVEAWSVALAWQLCVAQQLPATRTETAPCCLLTLYSCTR